MDAGTGRKLKAVGNLSDALQHGKWPGVARTQLALCARVKGLRGAVKEAQPHLVAHCEHRLAVVGVVVVLGQLLSLEKSLAHLRTHLIPAAKVASRLHLRRSGSTGRMGGGGRP